MIADLVSVIIPIYNTDKYLDKCLNSIINQTYKNIEIILIDDGSTDNSLDICKKYEHVDNRIKLLSTENKGVSSARNLGIKYSTGEYIIFIDSDDFIELNMIESLYTNIKNVDISICNYYKVKNNKKTKNLSIKYDGIIDNNKFFKYLFEDNTYGGYLWNKLIRKNVLEGCLFDEKINYMEDLIFLAQVSKNCYKVYYKSDLFLYNYVLRENSLISNQKINELNLDSFEKVINILEKDIDLKNKCLCDYIFCAMKIKFKLKPL